MHEIKVCDENILKTLKSYFSFPKTKMNTSRACDLEISKNEEQIEYLQELNKKLQIMKESWAKLESGPCLVYGKGKFYSALSSNANYTISEEDVKVCVRYKMSSHPNRVEFFDVYCSWFPAMCNKKKGCASCYTGVCRCNYLHLDLDLCNPQSLRVPRYKEYNEENLKYIHKHDYRYWDAGSVYCREEHLLCCVFDAKVCWRKYEDENMEDIMSWVDECKKHNYKDSYDEIIRESGYETRGYVKDLNCKLTTY